MTSRSPGKPFLRMYSKGRFQYRRKPAKTVYPKKRPPFLGFEGVFTAESYSKTTATAIGQAGRILTFIGFSILHLAREIQHQASPQAEILQKIIGDATWIAAIPPIGAWRTEDPVRLLPLTHAAITCQGLLPIVEDLRRQVFAITTSRIFLRYHPWLRKFCFFMRYL